jgi:hypothetical protein
MASNKIDIRERRIVYIIVVLGLLCMIPLVIWGSRYRILSTEIRWIIPKCDFEVVK